MIRDKGKVQPVDAKRVARLLQRRALRQVQRCLKRELKLLLASENIPSKFWAGVKVTTTYDSVKVTYMSEKNSEYFRKQRLSHVLEALSRTPREDLRNGVLFRYAKRLQGERKLSDATLIDDQDAKFQRQLDRGLKKFTEKRLDAVILSAVEEVLRENLECTPTE